MYDDGNDPKLMNRTDDRHNMLDRCYEGRVFHLSIQGVEPLFLDDERKTLSHSEARALRALLRADLVFVPSPDDALTLEPIRFKLTRLGETTLQAWDGERPPASHLGHWRVLDDGTITNGVIRLRDETPDGSFDGTEDSTERNREAVASLLNKAVQG